jgi:hypothetical protein
MYPENAGCSGLTEGASITAKDASSASRERLVRPGAIGGMGEVGAVYEQAAARLFRSKSPPVDEEVQTWDARNSTLTRGPLNEAAEQRAFERSRQEGHIGRAASIAAPCALRRRAHIESRVAFVVRTSSALTYNRQPSAWHV